MKNNRAIGIIGGMGPEASEYLYKELIQRAISEYGVKNNDQFPEIVLYSVPIPDFISNDENKTIALKILQEKVRLLNKTDISCLSIACNTVHVLQGELQKISKVPFVSMIDEVIKKVLADKISVVGLVGTPSTIRYKLYQSPLEEKGIKVLTPNLSQITILEEIIRNVIAGKLLESDTRKLLDITDSLKKIGAKGIVLGCTELPLVFPRKYSLPFYNSVTILAQALLRKYYLSFRKGGKSYA